MGRELRIQLGENKGERQTEDKLSKSTRFTCSDFGKIDKNYDFFTFCETVHRNQNLEPLPKTVLGEPKITTLSQYFTRKVPDKP